MQLETGYRSTLGAKLNATDITCEVATAPTVTAGRMHVYKGNTHAWIKFTNVTGTTLTGVTFVSQTANPATTVTGATFPAGTNIELVEMHDQMFNAQEGGTVTGNVTVTGDVSVGDDFTVTGDTVMGLTFKEPVYANAAARDAAIPSPANGMSVYLTAEGYFSDYQAGVWGQRSTGTSTPNASTTVAGKVEIPTAAEIQSLSPTGGTGAPLAITPDTLGNHYSKGDGSDGDVTVSVNGTLTRDMYYNNLTVNTGITLDPAGYAIYVAGTLTLTGTAKIVRNGNNGGNASGATGGTGATALATGTVGVSLGGASGPNGGIGAGTNGTAGTAVNPSYATTATASAAGGNGGAGGSGGGTGGATAAATQGVAYNTVYNIAQALAALMSPARGIQSLAAYGALPSGGSGASGGGNGGGTSGGGGGGSGGNGGTIFVYANIIAGSGTIESKGGTGGNGGNSSGAVSGGGGGGAGGSGGIVVLVYKSGTPYTITLTGGTGGAAGTSTSGTATAGGNGTVGQSIVINK